MSGELPPSWAEATLDDVAQINPPGALTTVPDEQEVTFVPMAAVEELTGRIDLDGARAFGEVKKGFTRFREGDVLFAKITPCMENGKITVARGLRQGIGCGSTEFHVLRPNGTVLPEYLRYYLVQSAFRRDAQRNMQGAVGQQRVPTDFLRASRLPVAPLPEQQRIVSRIEELFSEIDEGERALQRVGRLVERYRQSVLKAAVTGELTREWREQQRTDLEDAGVLLRRVGEAKRAASIEAGQRCVEPCGADGSGLGALPPGWLWVTVEQLCFVETGATPKRGEAKYYGEGTIPWVTSGAVNAARITEPTELITECAVAETNAKVFPAGTLVVAMYGEGKTRGKVSELGIAAATNQACAALLCAHMDEQVKSYVRLFFEKHYEELRNKAAGGVQPNLNLSIIKQTALPLPPLAELQVVCDRVATRLSEMNALGTEVLQRSPAVKALRQSVLRAAFSGQLVPQDANDEPAAALLARLAAQAAEAPIAPKRGGRPRRQPTTT